MAPIRTSPSTSAVSASALGTELAEIAVRAPDLPGLRATDCLSSAGVAETGSSSAREPCQPASTAQSENWHVDTSASLARHSLASESRLASHLGELLIDRLVRRNLDAAEARINDQRAEILQLKSLLASSQNGASTSRQAEVAASLLPPLPPR